MINAAPIYACSCVGRFRSAKWLGKSHNKSLLPKAETRLKSNGAERVAAPRPVRFQTGSGEAEPMGQEYQDQRAKDRIDKASWMDFAIARLVDHAAD